MNATADRSHPLYYIRYVLYMWRIRCIRPTDELLIGLRQHREEVRGWMVLEEHEEGLMKLAHRRHQWVDDD